MLRDMRIEKSTSAKLGAVVLAVATIFAVPGVPRGLGALWDAIERHPLPVVLGVMAAALLIYGYWDSLLRLFRIYTPTSLNRSMRKWLDVQKYPVNPLQDPPDFLFEAKDKEPPFTAYTFKRREHVPWGVEIMAGLGTSQEHAAAIATADLAVVHHLRVQILQGAANLGLDVALVGDPAVSGQPFVFGISVLPAARFSHKTFFEAIHSVRLFIALITVAVQEAAGLPFDPPLQSAQNPQLTS